MQCKVVPKVGGEKTWFREEMDGKELYIKIKLFKEAYQMRPEKLVINSRE